MSKFYENNFISLIESVNPNNILIIDILGEKFDMEVIRSQLKNSIKITIINSSPKFYLKKIESEDRNIKLYEDLSEINCLDYDVIIINSDSEETINELLNIIYTDSNYLPIVLINSETYIEETSIENEVEEKNKMKHNISVKDVFLERNKIISNIKSTIQRFIIESSKNLFYQEMYISPFIILIYEKDKNLFNKINSLKLVNTEKEMYLNKLKKIYHEEKIVKNQPRLLLRRNEILSKQTEELFKTIEILGKQLEQENSSKLDNILGSSKAKIKSILKK